jgi:hypothetical protein
MALSKPSSLIKTTGTSEADSVGQLLQVGSLSVEFDNGNLRTICLNGVEVLRGVAFLVRDENWGTYTATLRDLSIEQDAQHFVIHYAASCSRADQHIDYEARIEGHADGSLTFQGKALPRTDFLTARTGFVVLHPLSGVVGQSLKVEHVDGVITQSQFPAHVNPDCPFRYVRALSHQVFPGVWARCEMQGDAFEMEDHRNWTDASFKTYVRPLARPWPYVLPAGVAVEQSVSLKITGNLPKANHKSGHAKVELGLGNISSLKVPPIGTGLPAEEVQNALAHIPLMRLLSPKFVVCHFDPRQHHDSGLLRHYQQLASQLHAEVMLEVVVQSLTDYAQELQGVAQMAKAAGLQVHMLAVCPVGHLKSVLPGGTYPPAPELADLYRAARQAFPHAQLGGGMFSFFTELNRKRPPAQGLDFITNSTCPIVHAADDRSVMETLEALPWQIETAKHFTGGKPHHVGPSGIGARDNPHGATFSPNPHNGRVCLAKMDPRQRGLFAAAWTLGYVSTLVQAGVARISMAAPTGPLGMIYTRQAGLTQPWFDDLPSPVAQHTVYPVFHTMASLHCASGHSLVSVDNSAPRRVSSLAWSDSRGITLMVANMSAESVQLHLKGLDSHASFGMLDEFHFIQATTDAPAFRQASQWLPKNASLSLGAYAVACLHQPHG